METKPVLTTRRVWSFLLLAAAVGGVLLGVGCEETQTSASPGGESPPPGDGTLNGGGGALTSAEIALVKKIAQKKCKLCHDIEGEKVGLMKSPGFLTTTKTLPKRMAEATYRAKIDGLKERRSDIYEKSSAEIAAILAEPDLAKRQALWIRTYLKNPRFDDEMNRMNYVHMEKEEVDLIVRYMLGLE